MAQELTDRQYELAVLESIKSYKRFKNYNDEEGDMVFFYPQLLKTSHPIFERGEVWTSSHIDCETHVYLYIYNNEKEFARKMCKIRDKFNSNFYSECIGVRYDLIDFNSEPWKSNLSLLKGKTLGNRFIPLCDEHMKYGIAFPYPGQCECDLPPIIRNLK